MTMICTIRFTYTNHRGEVAERHARPIRVWCGESEWWPDEETWYLKCWDYDRKADRTFRFDHISNITTHTEERALEDPYEVRTG